MAEKKTEQSDAEKWDEEHAKLVEARKAAEAAVFDHRQLPTKEAIEAAAEAAKATVKAGTATVKKGTEAVVEKADEKVEERKSGSSSYRPGGF